MASFLTGQYRLILPPMLTVAAIYDIGLAGQDWLRIANG